MAINLGALETSVKAVVKTELDAKFKGAMPPTDPDVIYADLSGAIAGGVRKAIEALIADGVVTVTGVSTGTSSVTGGIQ